MPQPDSGDNCCDCPSRAGPCDDCGGVTCSNCDPVADVLFAPFCTDDDGNCRTGPETCDGCTGDIVPCGSYWLTDIEYCITCPATLELCAVSRHDPMTCESTLDCISHDCCATCGGDGTTHQASDVWVPCTTCSGLDCGACCHGDGCWTTNALECLNFGFIFHPGLSCIGDYCPV